MFMQTLKCFHGLELYFNAHVLLNVLKRLWMFLTVLEHKLMFLNVIKTDLHFLSYLCFIPNNIKCINDLQFNLSVASQVIIYLAI